MRVFVNEMYIFVVNFVDFWAKIVGLKYFGPKSGNSFSDSF